MLGKIFFLVLVVAVLAHDAALDEKMDHLFSSEPISTEMSSNFVLDVEVDNVFSDMDFDQKPGERDVDEDEDLDEGSSSSFPKQVAEITHDSDVEEDDNSSSLENSPFDLFSSPAGEEDEEDDADVNSNGLAAEEDEASAAEKLADHEAAKEQALLDQGQAVLQREKKEEDRETLTREDLDLLMSQGAAQEDIEQGMKNSSQSVPAGLTPGSMTIAAVNASITTAGQVLLTDHLSVLRAKFDHAKHVLKDRIKDSLSFQGARLLAKTVNQIYHQKREAAKKKYKPGSPELKAALAQIKAEMQQTSAYKNHQSLVTLAKKQYEEGKADLQASYRTQLQELLQRIYTSYSLINGTENDQSTVKKSATPVTAATKAPKKSVQQQKKKTQHKKGGSNSSKKTPTVQKTAAIQFDLNERTPSYID